MTVSKTRVFETVSNGRISRRRHWLNLGVFRLAGENARGDEL